MPKWFAPRRPPDTPAPPYAIRCDCGQAVRGARAARRQIVACPACGRKLFVLARSPLPAPDGAPPAGSSARLGPWQKPLLAAGMASAIFLIFFLALLPFLARPAPPTAAGRGDASDPAARLDAGRRALAEGDFHRASAELDAAQDQLRLRPALLPADRRRDLARLRGQADLLSRLLSRSLEEVVREADLVRHEDEWKARFDADYKGRTVVFDDVVRFDEVPLPDGRRRPVLRGYRVTVAGREVRLALEDLDALQPLASERPARMLFGGALAAVERGRGGQWVVHFEPGGVLITDRGAAEAVCPAPLDPELIAVLERQQEWMDRREPAED